MVHPLRHTGHQIYCLQYEHLNQSINLSTEWSIINRLSIDRSIHQSISRSIDQSNRPTDVLVPTCPCWWQLASTILQVCTLKKPHLGIGQLTRWQQEESSGGWKKRRGWTISWGQCFEFTAVFWHCLLDDRNGIKPAKNLCWYSQKVLFRNEWRKNPT